MRSKELTQKQFNTVEGTIHSVHIDMADMDKDDIVDYLNAKCKGWFMSCYETDRPNQFLFQYESDCKHYKAWAGWTTFTKQI